MEVAQVVPRFLVQSLYRCVKYLLVFGDDDALPNREVTGRVVVLKRLVVSIADHAHHRLHEGFTCTEVPVFEPRHQVDVEVGLLIQHVDDFVSCASHSRDMHGAEGLKNLIHAFLVLVHGADRPHIVVLIRNAVLGGERTQ